jgi:hypothetical protein
MITKYLLRGGAAEGGSARRLSDRRRSLGSRLATWLDTCADRWAAAAMYQQLSSLSDAQLARRGLSRATLAHDLDAAAAATRSREIDRDRIRILPERYESQSTCAGD